MIFLMQGSRIWKQYWLLNLGMVKLTYLRVRWSLTQFRTPYAKHVSRLSFSFCLLFNKNWNNFKTQRYHETETRWENPVASWVSNDWFYLLGFFLIFLSLLSLPGTKITCNSFITSVRKQSGQMHTSQLLY